MKRRQFIKYSSLGTASLGITACAQGNLDFLRSSETSLNLNNKFGSLEKTNLILGFVPTTDAAPLIIAQEKGFFKRYGLEVTLKRRSSWEAIEKGLLSWQLDAAQAPFALPMSAQLGKQKAPLISLMNLNLNGSAITLTKKAWEKGLRPSLNYNDFRDFERSFRRYIRGNGQTRFAIDSSISMDAYLLRYWLAAMGVDPDREVRLLEFQSNQLIYKLQAQMIEGYSISAPWTRSAIIENTGFIINISREIWRGHPNKILAAMDGWVRRHPVTARSLMAGLLEACQYCEHQRHHREMTEILAQSQYLNLDRTLIEPTLNGKYAYTNNTPNSKLVEIPDFTIFHYQDTPYLKIPDHANYPWRSHAVWLLTQMIRWNQLETTIYPKDADRILERIYPISLYKEVAEALNIKIPSESMKSEPTNAFIDGRPFDPSQPLVYLNQFSIRASYSQFLSFV
ncbi:MAG: ABC transporter substrate-binding protein [cyanobacterium endosymbiont of Rhopalodia gibba]|jgi:nitrate/nitrite transport system substrate-binding protein